MDIFPGAKLMQVEEWGYFMGSLRPAPPPHLAFSVIHITANLATAENEAGWRINDPALQNSATFFNNRDGSTVQLLGDPATMDPWANGDMSNPDLSNPRIAAVVRDRVNANERTLLAIENVGNEIAWGKVPGGYPITPEQELTCARQIAHYHTRNGVPINRETVIGHYQLNSTSRPNCPSRDKSVIDRIVAKAQQIAASPEEDMQFWKPVQEDWYTVAKVPDKSLGTIFYDGSGNKKEFTGRERVRSVAESSDGRYRQVKYPFTDPKELLVVDARGNDKEGPGLTPIPGTRVPATGFGFPAPEVVNVVKEVPTGITQTMVNAAVAKAKDEERERIATAEANRIKSI